MARNAGLQMLSSNMRLLRRFHTGRKCIRIMCRVTRHHTRKHHISGASRPPSIRAPVALLSSSSIVKTASPKKVASHLDRGTGGEAGHPRHQALRSFEGAEILRARLSYGRRSTGLHLFCSAVGWWMASSLQVFKIKVLYDSAVQKLLDEVARGLSLLDAANKSEWHNITRVT
jgi:hypothetical protein